MKNKVSHCDLVTYGMWHTWAIVNSIKVIKTELSQANIQTSIILIYGTFGISRINDFQTLTTSCRQLHFKVIENELLVETDLTKSLQRQICCYTETYSSRRNWKLDPKTSPGHDNADHWWEQTINKIISNLALDFFIRFRNSIAEIETLYWFNSVLNRS